jgi:hypothetical protein
MVMLIFLVVVCVVSIAFVTDIDRQNPSDPGMW